MRVWYCWGLLGLLAMAAQAQHFERVFDGVMVNDGGDSRAVCWIDIDNDGDLDLFVTNGPEGGQNNFLYRNDGGTYVRITTDPIASDGAPSDGATWGDVDNDGDLDCFVANWYGVNNLLYRNLGLGTFFLDTSSPAGNDDGYSESGSWADYDNDGWLDLVVANSDGASHRNFIYHNNGSGNLIKVTPHTLEGEGAASRAPLWADYDNDGDLDLYIANESAQNDYLYQNNGGGSFLAINSGVVTTSGGYTATGSWGDYDNDGDLDLFAGNFGPLGNACNGNDFLFRNDGLGAFTSLTSSLPATQGGCSFGSVWGDFDNDGDLDLFVTNGFRPSGNTNFLYWNSGDGNFTRETADVTTTDNASSYGVAAADYDRDGDLDLFVADWTPPGGGNNRLYRNLAQSNGNHWLGLRLKGTTSNRAAIGARVRVKAVIDTVAVWQMREVAGQTGYCGQTLEQHFGLGNAVTVDSLWVRWPTGAVEVFTDVAGDQFITLTEGSGWSGVPAPPPSVPRKFGLLTGYPNPFNPAVEIRFELPETGFVELAIYDLSGRRVATLVDAVREAGEQRVRWDSAGASSGVYFCRLRAGTTTATMKLLKIG